MELSMFDILILFILAIAVSLIIAANVLYVVDTKLNDIQINIPSCPIPICPTPICSEINGKIDNNKIVTPGNNNKNEHFINPPYEPPDQDYADKNVDYQTITTQTYTDQIQHKLEPKLINHYVPQIRLANKKNENIQTSIKNSSDKNTQLLRQGYINHDNNENTRKVTIKQINNPSLCNSYTNELVEDSINTVDMKYTSPMSNDVNNIKRSIIKFYVPKLYMGHDPNIAGVSYASMNIEEPADTDQIGSIPVNDYDGEPIPISDFVN